VRRTRAVFVDRDGTLIEDVGYARDPDDVCLVDGAAEALATFRRQGFQLVVVSNQSGIGRGLISPEEASAVHDRFVAELAAGGVRLDDVRYCPHGPDEGCDCRKPEPGLLLAAARKLGVDLASSFMIGDEDRDVEAGRRAGCTTILIDGTRSRSDEPFLPADHVARDWNEAVRLVAGDEAA
jgi:D-glycero-D-manno-heptose 1,7-bisphosphate phosphatase